MNINEQGYRKLNLSMLKFSDSIISTEDALKNIAPISFSKDILNGKKKINVTKVEKDYENKCVKFEISY